MATSTGSQRVREWFETLGDDTSAPNTVGSLGTSNGLLGSSSPTSTQDTTTTAGILTAPNTPATQQTTPQTVTPQTGNPYPNFVQPATTGAPAPSTYNGPTYSTYQDLNQATNPTTPAATIPGTFTLPGTNTTTPSANAPLAPATTPAGTPVTPTTPAGPPNVTNPNNPTPNTTPGTSTSVHSGVYTGGILNPNGSTTIDPNALTERSINFDTDTAEGRMNRMLSGNNPYIQGARDRAARAGAARGLLNTTLAGTGGEEAATNAAFQVANPDAAAYREVDAYNAALHNQALMYNVDQQNQFQLQSNTIAGQQAIAQISAASAANVAGINASAQLSAATLSAENQRFIAQMNSETSRYNTDQNYRTAQDNQRNTLANNIIQNMDMDPVYKQSLLNALGMSALASAIFKPDPDLQDIFGGSAIEGQTRINAAGKTERFTNGAWV